MPLNVRPAAAALPRRSGGCHSLAPCSSPAVHAPLAVVRRCPHARWGMLFSVASLIGTDCSLMRWKLHGWVAGPFGFCPDSVWRIDRHRQILHGRGLCSASPRWQQLCRGGDCPSYLWFRFGLKFGSAGAPISTFWGFAAAAAGADLRFWAHDPFEAKLMDQRSMPPGCVGCHTGRRVEVALL